MQLQTGVGADECATFTVDIYGVDKVACERCRVARYVSEHNEFGSVISVQSVFGGYPNHPVIVLAHFHDEAARYVMVGGEQLIRLTRAN